MILLNLDRDSKTPLFQQVYSQLKDLIELDTLKPGDKLPSTRMLAEHLGVHRSTVYKAYEELWALGYLDSRPGSYSTVRKKQDICTIEKRSPEAIIDWDEVTSPNADRLHRLFNDFRYHWWGDTDSDVIDMGGLCPDSRLFPVDEYRKCLNRVLLDDGPNLLRYGECEGYRPLREYIAQRLRVHGVSITWEEILITNGAQDGLDLIMKLMAKPNCRVFLESPTYALALPILRYYNTEIIGIPMVETGINLQELEKELQIGRPIFLYTMPNFHNPTGVTTCHSHREELLSICEKYRVPLVEDAFEEEMKYCGKVPLPIKSMDKNQIVIYLGSFSKVLFPGIRIGWIAANRECIERMAALKRFNDISMCTPVQAALAEFCWQGHYEHHINRMHRIYRKRLQTAVDAMRKHITHKKVSWIEPNGGYVLWVCLEDIHVDDATLHQKFVQKGVRVAFGKVFFPRPVKKTYLRLSIASLNEEEIVEGICRLGRAVDQIYEV